MSDNEFDFYRKLLLNKSREIKSKRSKRGYILRLNILFIYVGLVHLAISLACGIFSYIFDKNYIIAIIIFASIGLSFILSYINYKITLTDDQIIKRNIYRFSKEINWVDVIQVEFKNIGKYLKISSKNKNIKIDNSVAYFYTIIYMMKIKLNQELINEAINSVEIFFSNLLYNYDL